MEPKSQATMSYCEISNYDKLKEKNESVKFKVEK